VSSPIPVMSSDKLQDLMSAICHLERSFPGVRINAWIEPYRPGNVIAISYEGNQPVIEAEVEGE
jgi:hypothetical protein